jgi:hypothetical protein
MLDVSSENRKFEVEAGTSQGSVLGPLLYLIVLEAVFALSERFTVAALYANDWVFLAESEEVVRRVEALTGWLRRQQPQSAHGKD